jgi:hypothetical protein
MPAIMTIRGRVYIVARGLARQLPDGTQRVPLDDLLGSDDGAWSMTHGYTGSGGAVGGPHEPPATND